MYEISNVLRITGKDLEMVAATSSLLLWAVLRISILNFWKYLLPSALYLIPFEELKVSAYVLVLLFLVYLIELGQFTLNFPLISFDIQKVVQNWYLLRYCTPHSIFVAQQLVRSVLSNKNLPIKPFQFFIFLLLAVFSQCSVQVYTTRMTLLHPEYSRILLLIHISSTISKIKMALCIIPEDW